MARTDRFFGAALLIAAIFFVARPALGVESISIHGLNQAEYSLNTSSSRDSTQPKEIFEEWLDLDIRFDDVLIGFRYEGFQPHELSPRSAPPDSVREGIVQRYAQFDVDAASIRVGNFYEIFGRGLLFRAYEERSVRVDNNLDGALFLGSFGRVKGKAFSGRMRDIGPGSDDRNDVLHGIDLEGDLGRGLSVGGSYLLQTTRSENRHGYAIPPAPRREEAIGGRLFYSHDYFDLYGEAGRINRFEGGHESGKGYYGAFSAYPIDLISFTIEAKDYNHFRFSPRGSDTDYNNPPSLSRETSYTLISRTPHQLNANDERGFQVEAVLTPLDGAMATLSRSETAHVDGDLFRHGGLSYHEWYADWKQDVGESWVVGAAYDYISDSKTAVQNHTSVVDLEYITGGEWGIRGEYQYQQSEGVASYIVGPGSTLIPVAGFARNHLALIEFVANYNLTISAVGEHATSFEATEVPKDDFAYVQVDYRISQANYLSVTAGRRQAGFVCVGGVCRFEPAFDGVEVKLLTSF